MPPSSGQFANPGHPELRGSEGIRRAGSCHRTSDKRGSDTPPSTRGDGGACSPRANVVAARMRPASASAPRPVRDRFSLRCSAILVPALPAGAAFAAYTAARLRSLPNAPNSPLASLRTGIFQARVSQMRNVAANSSKRPASPVSDTAPDLTASVGVSSPATKRHHQRFRGNDLVRLGFIQELCAPPP